MQKDYLKLAKNLIDKHDLRKFVDILLSYWEENPTTLGHGFWHVLKVAVESYEIGELNGYEKCEDLFVGGLFHDIYRPAEGLGANEDQTKGAEIVEKLFAKNDIGSELTERIVGAIKTHDNWRGEKNLPLYDLYLSLGDKASHDITQVYSYCWASNKYAKENNLPPFFSNHLQGIYAMVKYQQRAWEVLMKHPAKGVERCVDRYLDTGEQMTNNYRNDPRGEKFFDYVEEQAEAYRTDENRALKYFGVSADSIKKLMKRFY